MKITRICVALATAGIVTLGAVGTASATTISTGPELTTGAKTAGPGSEANLLNTPYTPHILTVPLGVATVKLGGTIPDPSTDNLLGLVAHPVPATVCVLCHPAPPAT